MAIFRKKDLTELVGGDIFASGNDRNPVSNSEIETGPTEKPYNDDAYYEKGASTTTDKVFGQYRQNIPWFAVYSFGGSRTGRGLGIDVPLSEKNIVTKKSVEEKIEDLVKKSKNIDLTGKDYSYKVEKLIDAINDTNLTDTQLEELHKAIMDRKENPKQNKNI